jgi:hypothetical protein
MIDRNLARGLFLGAIAAAFGLGALRFPIGRMANPGPGLFPVLVSGLLLVLATSLIVQSRLVARVTLVFNGRSIGLILFGLISFVVCSEWLNMMVGIAVMVFATSLAGTSFSVWRSVKITVGLIAVAAAFQSLLGVDLDMY